MILGILSDTHDHLDHMKRAVEIFNSRGVVHILHAGDFTSPFTARALSNFKGEFTGVFGNNDGDKLLLEKMYKNRIFNQPYTLNLDGKKIVVMHEPDLVDALAESGHFDLIIHGHTHEAYIKKVKDTLIINPGETSGWLYGKPSIAIVNLETMDAEIIPIE